MKRAKRIRSKRFAGVYTRESSGNRPKMYNGRLDRSYYILYADGCGKRRFECVGRASWGMTEAIANTIRMERLVAALKVKSRREHPEVQDSVVLMLRPPSASGQELFSALVENYLNWLKKEGKHVEKERNRYQKHIHNRIGAYHAADINWTVADALKHELLETMAPSSAKKCLSLCSAVYGYHNRSSENVLLNPFGKENGFVMPVVDNQCERYLTLEEAVLLLNALRERSPQLHDMSVLSLYTGLRAGEIFDLRGRDLNPELGIIYVTAKGGKRSPVRVNKMVMDILLKSKTGENKYIFRSRTGEKLKQVSDTFLRVAEELGMSPPTTQWVDGKLVPIKMTKEERADYQRQKVWFHTLRHTFATWLATSGDYTLRELQDKMRHKSITMTERYTHCFAGAAKDPSGYIQSLLDKAEA